MMTLPAGAPMTRIRLPYIHEYRDRTRRLRRYVRLPGRPRTPLPGHPGSAEFMAAYQAATGDTGSHRLTKAKGTLSRLAADFYRSVEFANLKPSSKATYRIALDPVLQKHGHRAAADPLGLRKEKARKIVEDIGADRPALANLTASVLRKLFAYAVDTGLRPDNPFAKVPAYKLGTHHTWTDAELAQYEAHWPLGTYERLAYEVLLWTAQRVGDAVRLLRPEDDKPITLTQEKTGEEMAITVHPTLAKAIAAGPNHGPYLITDRKGRQMTGGALSHFVRRSVKAAGLPERCVPHGLRKAAMRRLAEHGASSKELQSMSGHRTLKEVERYTAKADQAMLSKAAMAKMK